MSRPHQAKDNDLLVPDPDATKADEPEVVRLSEIRCKKRLGGLLKHYCHRAERLSSGGLIWSRRFDQTAPLHADFLGRDEAPPRAAAIQVAEVAPGNHRPNRCRSTSDPDDNPSHRAPRRSRRLTMAMPPPGCRQQLEPVKMLRAAPLRWPNCDSYFAFVRRSQHAVG